LLLLSRFETPQFIFSSTACCVLAGQERIYSRAQTGLQKDIANEYAAAAVDCNPSQQQRIGAVYFPEATSAQRPELQPRKQPL
jgi:hypothetical protein